MHKLVELNGVPHRELYLFGPELYGYTDKRRTQIYHFCLLSLSLLSRPPAARNQLRSTQESALVGIQIVLIGW
jgi:hypothetical protein